MYKSFPLMTNILFLIGKKLKIILVGLCLLFFFIASTTAIVQLRINDSVFLGMLFFITPIAIYIAFIHTKTSQQELKCNSIVSAFNQMVQAVFISDSKGKIIEVNSAACKLLAYSEIELTGKTLESFYINPKFLNKAEFQINITQIECVFVKKNGEHFYGEIWKQHLDDERILEIVRDISQQKKEQQRIENLIDELKYQRDLIEERSAELIVMSAQLEESEKKQKDVIAEKDKFFSIIAHDLKSPFAGIMGYSTLLLEEFDNLSNEEMKEFISSLDKLSKNTFKLIENLLDWSRLQTGKMKCAPGKLQLYETVLYATSLVSANAERKEIKILNQISEHPHVYADERMMNSILENLLSNAIKFTPRGGKVSLSSTPINIFHEITVEDTGIGMSPEVLEKIFRIDSSYTTLGTEHEKGTGLGVILCKEMIEKQGGAVKVESRQGVGTKFKFILPAWSE